MLPHAKRRRPALRTIGGGQTASALAAIAFALTLSACGEGDTTTTVTSTVTARRGSTFGTNCLATGISWRAESGSG
jgi:hypothetical protein